jgi:hypothetical protein
MSSNEDKKLGGSPDPSATKVDDKILYEETTTFSDPRPKDEAFTTEASDSDEDGAAYRKNPFIDPDVAEHWASVYEKSKYECRAQFDPDFTWTEEEEKKLVRRLDWHVCLWAVRIHCASLWFLSNLSTVRYVLRSTSRSR